jgi:hypothetical protein
MCGGHRPCPLPGWWRQRRSRSQRWCRSRRRRRTRHRSRRRRAAWRGQPDVVITIHSSKGSKKICGYKILTVITSRSTVEASTVLIGVDGGEIHRHRDASAEVGETEV